ncbi:MAG: GntR family transcriptional regulator [Propionibacteriaceae bacterium]|nr:GntR family transcriptional regulator [Micropruina sp.]
MVDGTAKYATVRDHLARRIAEMSPGDQLPTEPTLCQEYGVSRITIRRAVEDLMRTGYLSREQGRGTFVTLPKYVHARETFAERITGFYRQQTLLGREVTTRVLANHVVHNPDAATALGLHPADAVIEIARLRYVNGSLHQHVLTYLSAARFPDVLTQDLTQGSLFDYLEKSHQLELARNDLLVRVEHLDENLATALAVPVGDSVLAIESTVFLAEDEPVAFGITRHTPANSEIAFKLYNHPGGDS